MNFTICFHVRLLNIPEMNCLKDISDLVKVHYMTLWRADIFDDSVHYM